MGNGPTSETESKRVYYVIVYGCGALSIAVAALRSQPDLRMTALVTIILALELMIRFRYVIRLLNWPRSVGRFLLLTAFWLGLIAFGWLVPDREAWVVCAAVLFAIGVAIEVHNLVTRQWVIGDDVFRRSLRNDILRGIGAAAFAVAGTLIVSRRWPEEAPAFVLALVVADMARFTEMVVRHRRLRG